MSHKDTTTYQEAYKSAIDLHRYLETNKDNYSEEEINQLKGLSRDIIGNIAESYSQKTAKAKRFFNFKALDLINRLILDIDFLHDTQKLDDFNYTAFYNSYEKYAKQLYKINTDILETGGKNTLTDCIATAI
jgi:hypothetical protein